MRRRILVADDSQAICEQLRQLLEAGGAYQVDTTADGQSALEALSRTNYSFFLTDLRMPKLDGMRLIEEVRRRQLPVTVLVLTGYGSIDKAVQALRLGAYDFLTKPIDIEHLRLVLERAARERQLQDEIAELRDQLQRQHGFQNVLSKSPRMQAVFELIRNVAATMTTVLIEGETGTGKELVA
jgi:DNA-binding NtrC family response regulator